MPLVFRIDPVAVSVCRESCLVSDILFLGLALVSFPVFFRSYPAFDVFFRVFIQITFTDLSDGTFKNDSVSVSNFEIVNVNAVLREVPESYDDDFGNASNA